MGKNRTNSHSVSRLSCHLVWVTKYRYPVLNGKIQKRCREILIQICDAEDVGILSGAVAKEHIHMHIEYGPKHSLSNLLKKLKGRTSRKLQMEYPELKKRYWGKHFWAIGYGAWSTGNVTEEMINNYIENHRNPSNADNADSFVLE